MYTDEDLTVAIKAGIFTEQSVEAFRKHNAELKNTVAVDEENFQLITSFNDIYVVIACALVLMSAAWFGNSINNVTGALVFAASSWALAEYFVLKRHMALPAIALLLSFLGGVLASSIYVLGGTSEITLLAAGCLTAFAAWLHWRRFEVPITIAGGTGAAIGCLLAITAGNINAELKEWFVPALFLSGIATFIYAMYWDSADRLRKTRKSDVAFWLHLLSAPLIVHPIFSVLGIFEGNSGLPEAIAVLLLYIGMAFVSVSIDRRAIMVSGLAYVLYAISTLLKTYGVDASSSAITGILIGGALLLLSVYWHACRSILFKVIPQNFQVYLPPLK